MSKRKSGNRILTMSTIEDVINLIHLSKKIIVVSGAGISVSCGIPDFRSKDVGIYYNLDIQEYNIPSAELLFDLQYFLIDPLPFYKFSKFLVPNDEILPSLSHKFIKLLDTRHKLLRNYTQNIDMLERKVGIAKSKLLECHGSMSKFKCTKCKKNMKLENVIDSINKSEVCYCKCGEFLKPNITFFGEEIPNEFHKAFKLDLPQCDLILVIGTSLKVGGSVQKLLLEANSSIPQILINREIVQHPNKLGKGFDAVLLGDCDSTLSYISSYLNWSNVLGDFESSQLSFQWEKVCENTFKITNKSFLSLDHNDAELLNLAKPVKVSKSKRHKSSQ